MNTLRRSYMGLLFAVSSVVAVAQGASQHTGAVLTPELLQNRIVTTEGSTELDDATKTRLIELYRESIGNLQATRANEAAAAQYREAAREAPQEAQRIREKLDRRRDSDPASILGDLATTSSREVDRMLDEESANLTAVEAKLAIVEARLDAASRRPAEARTRIAEAQSQMEVLAVRSTERSATGDSAQVAEAARWTVETRLEMLRTEIEMLDQELLTHAARNDLLQAQRDETESSVTRIRRRIELLRTAASARRRDELEVAGAQARDALAGASSGEPLVRELAEANLSLIRRLHEQIAELDDLASRRQIWPRPAEIDAAFRGARRKLELEGSTAPVGLAIQAEHERFPPVADYERQRRALGRSIVDVSLRVIESEDTRHELIDVGAYVDRRIEDSGGESLDPSVRGELERLATTRRSLLDQAIANDTTLQQELYELDQTLRRLAERMTVYDEFLSERMLWVRSNPPYDLKILAQLRHELREYLRPGRWVHTIRQAGAGFLKAPIFALLGLVALALAGLRGRMRSTVASCGDTLGRANAGSTRITLRALLFTLLWAAPVPLLLWAVAGALFASGDAGTFSHEVGSSLLRVGSWIALPLVVDGLLLPCGVANRHFGWPDDIVRRQRRQLAWFMGIAFPGFLVLTTSRLIEPPIYAGGTLTYVCFVIINLTFVALVSGILHPTRGTVSRLLPSGPSAARGRWRYVVFALATLLPVALLIVGWLGYLYSAQELMRRLFKSIWVLVGIWIASSLVRHWLLAAAWRLTDGVRPAGSAATTGLRDTDAGRPETGVEEPAIDAVALGADSRQLLNAFVLLAIVLALAAIWGDMIPALGVLERVDLWTHAVLVDGVERAVPVTLFDVVFAALVGIVGYLLAKNLPSLLDIILLKQGRISAGARYTVGTLTRYAVTTAAVLAVLHRLGASTSQLGWAAAALGVGIGFGLQEIVANFICGLILLFERPVRVGDVVTIGDTSGVVSRIRIRATTIRDWEQKELIVPNKELITGRLLNWTLSDSVTRILIPVGVAYGSDVDRAMKLMLDAAKSNPLVLRDPAPRVLFEEFAESSLKLTLRAFTSEVINRMIVTSELHQAIDRSFREAGIVIAFPQRDIHLVSGGEAPPAAT